MTISERINDRIKTGFQFVMLEALPLGVGMLCACALIVSVLTVIIAIILFVKRIVGQ